MSYEVVRYRSELKDSIARLAVHLWNEDVETNLKYLEWKYEQNPFCDEPKIYLALYKGTPVGMRGFMDACWCAGNPPERLAALTACDLVIDPAHRQKGLVGQIMSAAYDRLSPGFLFNLSGNRINVVNSLATGWKKIGELSMFRRVSAAGKFYGKLPGWIPFPTGVFDRLDRNAQAASAKSIVIENSPRCEEMAGLVARCGPAGGYSHTRNQQYFSWRFRNPLARYRFLYRYGSGTAPRLKAYLVLHTRAFAGRRRVSLVDWQTEEGSIDSILLRAAVKLGRFPGIGIWRAGMPEPARASLHDAGFREVPQGRDLTRYRGFFLMRCLQPGMDGSDETRRMLDIGNWNLRMVFSDSF